MITNVSGQGIKGKFWSLALGIMGDEHGSLDHWIEMGLTLDGMRAFRHFR